VRLRQNPVDELPAGKHVDRKRLVAIMPPDRKEPPMPSCLFRRFSKRRAFTMVEIILVVVIIMTLAAVVGPRLVGKAKQAKINTTKIQMSAIKTALGSFDVAVGRLPSTSEGLEALAKRPSGLSEKEWPDKFMDEVPKDAWGQPFEYKSPSEHGKDYDLISGGPDKKIGTDDDITNFAEDKETGGAATK
jgi:general secretion pathway protein G